MSSGRSDRGSSRHSAGLLLRVHRPDGGTDEFYLAMGLTIGRSVANAVVLAEDDAVDRAHARVAIAEDGTARLRCIEPEGSLWVGDAVVRELVLDAGVRFRIGRTEFECLSGQRGSEAGSRRARATCPFCDTQAVSATGDDVRRCPECSNPVLPVRPAPNDSVPLLVPVVYGHYRAERYVARGGMGLVLKGAREGGAEPVAIKVLLPGLLADRRDAERFEQEVAMLERVRHPNVVKLLDHGLSGRFHYLALEWIEGPSLRQVIADAKRAGKLADFATAFRWFEQVGKGLAAIHAVGMVHRDLKPSNILIGPDGAARIADLGIAKRIDTSYTTTGHAPGTFEYMAPEQLATPDTVDGRSDLYALGVTFYELLTGTRPMGAWRPASEVNPTVPKGFDAILGHLLAPRPEHRFDDIYGLLSRIAGLAPMLTVAHVAPLARVPVELPPRLLTDGRWGQAPQATETRPPAEADRREVSPDAGPPPLLRWPPAIIRKGAKVGAGNGAIWGMIILGTIGGLIGLPAFCLVAIAFKDAGALAGIFFAIAIPATVGTISGALGGALRGAVIASDGDPDAIKPVGFREVLAQISGVIWTQWRAILGLVHGALGFEGGRRVKHDLDSSLGRQGPEAFLALKRRGYRQLITGIIMATTGVGLTAWGYSIATTNPKGGEYFIFWGFILYGLVGFGRGFRTFLRADHVQRRTARLLLRVRGQDGRREEFYLASGLTIGPGPVDAVVVTEPEAAAPTLARIDLGEGGALLRCIGPVGSVIAAGGAVRELPLGAGVRFTIGRTEFECVDGRSENEHAPPLTHTNGMRARVEAVRGAYERASRGANSAAGRWAIRGALLLGALGLAIGGPIGLIVAIASGDWGVIWTTFVMIAVIFLLGLIFGGLVGALWGAIVGGCGLEPPASPRAIRGPLPAESWSRGEDDRSVQPLEAISGDVASGQPDDSSSPERPGSMAFRVGRVASGRSDATLFVDFSSRLGKKSATFLVWLTICVIAAVWRSSQPPQIKLDFTKPNLGLPPSKKAENATPNLQEAESHLWKSYYDRGVDRTQRGEWNLAIADFTEAIRLNPEGSQTYSQRGGAHVKKGDYRAAIADFTEAVRLDPTYGGGYTHRGNAYMKLSEIDKAIADFSEATRLEPTKPVNYELRGECRLKKREFDFAIADFDKAIRLDPNFRIAYFQRGEAYYAGGQYGRAIGDYTEAIRREPNAAIAFVSRGIAYRSNGEYDRSIADLNEAIRLDPTLGGAYLNRAVCHLERGDADSALADLTEVTKLDPRDAGGWSSRGTIYHLRGQEEQAVADLTRAIQLDPSSVQARNVRGLAYSAQGDQDRAIADFNEAIRLAPQSATAFSNRGLAFFRKRDFDRAVDDCDKAIAHDPLEAEAFLTKATALMAKGDLEGAIAEFTRAIGFQQTRARAYPVRGRCYQSKGMYDEAIADFNEAIRLNPQQAQSYRELLRQAESARRTGGR